MFFQRFGEKSHRFITQPWRDQARINILHGSVRSSKTITLIPKILELIKDGPKGKGLFVGVSKQTIYNNVLSDLFDTIGVQNYSYNKQTGELILFGDQWRVMGAKDEGSEKYVRGMTLGKAICDEASEMPQTFFLQLLNRLSVDNARLYATTNPDSPQHYLYTDFIANPEKLASGMVKAYHFELDDNPALSSEYKSFIRQAYKGVFYQRFILGQWVVAEGVIYRDCWSDDLLFNDDVKLDTNLMIDRFICCDYGTSNPQVYLEYMDDGNTLWITKEYFWDSAKEMRQKTDAEYADDLLAFMGSNHCMIITDPSAASFQAELRKRGLMVIDADNDVLNGIRRTSTVMSMKKIRVHESCMNTRREVALYSWDKKKGEKGEDQPCKQYDHCMDNIRYAINTKWGDWRLGL